MGDTAVKENPMDALPPEETIRSAVDRSVSRLRLQHEIAVQFATSVLRVHRADVLLDEACKAVSAGLHSRFAKVLRYQPESDTFVLEAGVGWDPADIGTTELGADDASPAGHALVSGRPVLSNHLGTEHRFRTPELLARHGIKRAINVPIRGIPETFGVLEADSSDDEDFTETDIVFLEAIANVISMSRERLAAESQTDADELFSTSVLNASTDCIQVLSLDGGIEFMNDNGLAVLSIDDFAEVGGTACADLWPDDQRPKVLQALAKSASGEPVRFEGPCPTRSGDARWWDVSVAPILDTDERVKRIVLTMRDVTERHENEEKLAALVLSQETQLGNSAMMMKHLHHRVRNSLQLVQTLLALQANLAGDKSVATHLQAAATRVRTVGSVHHRLYQDDGAEATDATSYLRGLTADLAELAAGREVSLEGESIVLPAARLAPLGLVTAELVTNALKYGRGTVRVKLERSEAAMLLTVEDEGDGFPVDFPKPQGTGLGMRLVTTYAGKGSGAVTVDRSVPFSRILVRFPAG
jgi:PAS domain S-box-containing protein